MKPKWTLIIIAFILAIMTSYLFVAELPAGYVAVHGTVVTPNGKPVVNAIGRTLDASGNNGPSWSSGNEGKFRTFLKPGRYKLWTIAAKSKAVTLIVPKSRSTISIKVIAKATLTKVALKFVRSNGVAISNAHVYCREKTSMGMRTYRPVTTDAKGVAILRLEDDAPINFTFSALDTGYAKLDIPDDETLSNRESFIVRFSADAASTASRYVSGRVMAESNGAPLGGIVFYPIRKNQKQNDPWSMWNGQFPDHPSAGASYTIADAMAASRDGDGAFRIGPIPPGDYDIKYGTPELGDPPKDLEIIRGSMTVSIPHDRDIKGLKISYPLAKPAYGLSGRIYQRNTSKLLTSTEIIVSVMTVYPPDQEPEHWYVWEPVVRPVITDDHGNFKLFPIRPGKYKIEGKWDKLSAVAKVDMHSDVRDLKLVLK